MIFPFLTVMIPAVALFWLLKLRAGNKYSWMIAFLAISSAVLFSFLAGLWAFVSYYLRFVPLVLLFPFGWISYKRIKRTKEREKGLIRPGIAAGILLFILFFCLDLSALAGHFYFQKPLRLTFPLKGGTYYAAQAGNSIVTNPFHVLYHTRYAIDIVKLNSFGNRAAGLFPKELTDYAVFGEQVYSPCKGKVIQTADGFPDLRPNTVDEEDPVGNSIRMECDGVRILMAHFKQGSILVKEGDTVEVGQPIAKVGNSGNTFEPHLHIQAAILDRNGKPSTVPITFDGRFLSLNSLFSNK